MITVFIGTYNRLSTLERSVASYGKFTTPHEIVLVDNGTDSRECQNLLKALERDKAVKKIYRLPGTMSLNEVANNFNVAIRDQFHTDGGEWFAVSDADVCFDGTPHNALDVYIDIAEEQKTAVGPHLRVDKSIPWHYPLRSRVLACETWVLYKDQMESTGGVFWSKCQTDTTFHLFPRTNMFRRLHMNPIRVGPPYDAMHLDWYLNITTPNRENEIYIPNRRTVGSWGKQWIRAFWRWFQKSPEYAFKRLMEEPLDEHNDLCNVSFMRSWCYQYGQGCEPDHDASVRWLSRAIPFPHEYYWPHQDSWMNMIYNNDFSGLGWV